MAFNDDIEDYVMDVFKAPTSWGGAPVYGASEVRDRIVDRLEGGALVDGSLGMPLHGSELYRLVRNTVRRLARQGELVIVRRGRAGRFLYGIPSHGLPRPGRPLRR